MVASFPSNGPDRRWTMRPTSTNFHPAGLMSTPDIFAISRSGSASSSIQRRWPYSDMSRSMSIVVVSPGEDVRRAVVAVNLAKCALARQEAPRFLVLRRFFPDRSAIFNFQRDSSSSNFGLSSSADCNSLQEKSYHVREDLPLRSSD